MLAKEIMTKNIITTNPQATLVEAARLMLEHGLNGLPVIAEEGRVVGMIGIKDILRVPIPSFYETPIHKWTLPGEKAALLSRVRVGQVMARNVVWVAEDTSAMEVAALMANRGLHPLPVLREGQIVGIIGRADVVKALLELSDAQLLEQEAPSEREQLRPEA